MAYEKIGTSVTDTLPLASSGLRQYRFVTYDSTAGVDYPNASTVGQPVTGVIISSGSTGSTYGSPVYATIQMSGIAKVEAEASTGLVTGALVSASTVGRAQPATNAGDFVVGRVISGSTGAANHIVTVALFPIGSTVAPSA
jgi:predicted aconitase with swiveling domain